MFATCTRAAALAAALLILAVLAASQSVDLSAEDCAAFQLGQVRLDLCPSQSKPSDITIYAEGVVRDRRSH